MATLSEEANGAAKPESMVQMGTLVEFYKRFGLLSLHAVDRLARGLSSGIEQTDHRRVSCLTCAQRKQACNRQSQKDTGAHSPVGKVGGVISLDLKDPMTPRDRLSNRYMINLLDCKSN